MSVSIISKYDPINKFYGVGSDSFRRKRLGREQLLTGHNYPLRVS